jgi:hypothetical protein
VASLAAALNAELSTKTSLVLGWAKLFLIDRHLVVGTQFGQGSPGAQPSTPAAPIAAGRWGAVLSQKRR